MPNSCCTNDNLCGIIQTHLASISVAPLKLLLEIQIKENTYMKIDKRLLNALLHIVVGALFAYFKAGIVNWILTAVGVVFIINGIIQVSNKKIAPGVVYIAIGVAIIVFGWTLVEIAMLVFGVMLILSAIADYSKSKKDKVDLVKLLVSVIVGGLLIFSGFKVIDWLFIVLGVTLILEGILQIITLIKNKK